ncbi:MAG TPA: arylsulfatase, partial [Segeticoccus sp.]|nr:arylsulfatase [Segeticoccus sp.]
HTVTAGVTTGERAGGVLVAQGGRFGGWSLYLREGHLCYADNCYGRDLVTVRSATPLPAGSHEVRVEFDFDGGPPGSGADVSLFDGDERVGTGRLDRTTAYYFSFDETLNVGVDRGTPVTDDYPPLRNGFDGELDWVRIELRGEPAPLSEAERERRAHAHQ